mmetsp:Transcript_8276/g.13353  ORF Transcript_8276/g.13353 Transcript_8276/m.13353 type:complete len:176 (+) Transcript_8276:109-636(+)
MRFQVFDDSSTKLIRILATSFLAPLIHLNVATKNGLMRSKFVILKVPLVDVQISVQFAPYDGLVLVAHSLLRLSDGVIICNVEGNATSVPFTVSLAFVEHCYGIEASQGCQTFSSASNFISKADISDSVKPGSNGLGCISLQEHLRGLVFQCHCAEGQGRDDEEGGGDHLEGGRV